MKQGLSILRQNRDRPRKDWHFADIKFGFGRSRGFYMHKAKRVLAGFTAIMVAAVLPATASAAQCGNNAGG
ncbi:MAG: lytic transglycosylase, partial [Rhizobium giardinii]